MRQNYGLGSALHTGSLVGSAYQECLFYYVTWCFTRPILLYGTRFCLATRRYFIIRYAVFISYKTACVRSESDESGAILKPLLREDTIILKPLLSEDTIILKPLLSEDTIILKPLLSEDTIILEPLLSEDTIILKPLLSEDTIILEPLLSEDTISRSTVTSRSACSHSNSSYLLQSYKRARKWIKKLDHSLKCQNTLAMELKFHCSRLVQVSIVTCNQFKCWCCWSLAKCCPEVTVRLTGR